MFWDDVGAAPTPTPDSVGAHSVRPPVLTPCGKIVEQAIQDIPIHYPTIEVVKYVVMPNHVHLLLLLSASENGRTLCAPTISRVIKQLKEYVTKEIGFPCWQKSFHDHVIRNPQDYTLIWGYIDTNPAKWEQDRFYCP